MEQESAERIVPKVCEARDYETKLGVWILSQRNITRDDLERVVMAGSRMRLPR